MKQWQLIRIDIPDKRGQIQYHASCKKCNTIRVLSEPEIQSGCGCDD